MLDTQTLMRISPIIPVVTLQTVSDAVALAEALYRGGIPILELALRTPDALKALEKIAKEVPHMCVGAGTVCNEMQFKNAIDAGAQFVFSPGITHELLNIATQTAHPFIPGVATASELMMALNAGFRYCKLFPASVVGGIPLLKAFSGPFGDALFCPTGGVNLENMNDYLALSNVVAVGGTWLSDAKLLANKDFEAITRLSQHSLQSIKKKEDYDTSTRI